MAAPFLFLVYEQNSTDLLDMEVVQRACNKGYTDGTRNQVTFEFNFSTKV